ncbi:hypothetical protein M0R45_007663 [Rubus argutus]|uniref:Uncharacterized protein n=1 Tax=Rubus argutus TaxID=59490 RepID=A0AAW1XZP3_RUBAR
MNKDRMGFSSNPFSELDPRDITLYLIKGATARPSRVIPRPSGKTAIKPADRPADRVSASLGARSSPRSRLSLRGARPSAFDHNAGPLASSTSMKGKDCAGSSSAQFIAGGLAMPFVRAVVMFTGHCSPLRGREAAEAAALLHTGLPLPIALSRGKRFADLIAKLSKDSKEVTATAAEREAVASLSLKDMKTVIFFYYLTSSVSLLQCYCKGDYYANGPPESDFEEGANCHQKTDTEIKTCRKFKHTHIAAISATLPLIALVKDQGPYTPPDGGKKFKFLYAIALESALKGLATLLLGFGGVHASPFRALSNAIAYRNLNFLPPSGGVYGP